MMTKRLRAPRSSGVYLLAFYKDGRHVRYGSSARGSALHYCGWARNIAARIKRHRQGVGARLVAAVIAAGYEARLVAVWDGQDRAYERKLKQRHNLGDFCPVCHPVTPAPARVNKG